MIQQIMDIWEVKNLLNSLWQEVWRKAESQSITLYNTRETSTYTDVNKNSKPQSRKPVYLQGLLYADDIALIAKNKKEHQSPVTYLANHH